MKGKKLAALILAVVMALTMLTACGGGGGSVSLGQVNTLLAQQGVDADVRSSGDLNQAVRQVAATLEQMNTFDTTVANTLMIQNRKYPVVSGDKARFGMGISVSEQDLGATTVEELVAICIMTLNKTLAVEGFDDYVDCYYVGATTATSASGTMYYVIGIEAEVEMPD